MTPPLDSGPPFRAEHVGSLLRPPELRRAFGARARGEISSEGFDAVLNRAVTEVVELQERVGLEVVTDGEFRRGSYWGHFVERVEGLGVRDALFSFRDEGGALQAFTAPHVEGALRRPRGISTDEYAFVAGVTRRVVKVTLPSPSTMHFWRGPEGIEPNSYDDLDALFADLARVYREEIAELARLGARYVQLDEVPLAMLCDAGVRERVRARGEEPDELVTRYVEAINAALAERPEPVRTAVHLCRGNFKGSYLSEGGYEPVAERIFNELRVDALLLEFDTERAGGFEPLRFVPEGKRAILGLVSTKTPEPESPDALVKRIEDAGRYLDPDQLGISPQCGFASTVAGNPLSVDDEARKLRLVVEVAGRVWGRGSSTNA